MFIMQTAHCSAAEGERSQRDTQLANSCANQVTQNPTANSCNEKYRGIMNQTEANISCHLHFLTGVATFSQLQQLRNQGELYQLPRCASVSPSAFKSGNLIRAITRSAGGLPGLAEGRLIN